MSHHDFHHSVSNFPHTSAALDPVIYADTLVKQGIIPSDKKTEAVAITLATPTSLFLYDGARLVIEKIVSAGSDVVLWTQGDPQLQTAKCDTSGLLHLAAAAQGHIEISAAADKIAVLDSILTRDRISDKKRIVIVDDKSHQLFRTYQDILKLIEVDHRMLPDDILYLWMRHDEKTKNVFPPGFPSITELTSFIKSDFKTAESITEVPIFANTLYLIDFDRTLMDSDKWFTTVNERIVAELGAH